MPSTRVPWVGQNDRRRPVRIRCGAASIQMILYGREDSVFSSSTLAHLKPSVDVVADQELIWTQVKQQSPLVAQQLNGTTGPSESEQVCDPRNTPRCWSTHPAVMAQLLRDGVDVSNRRLPGVAAHVLNLDLTDVRAAVVESIDRGVGLAIHTLGMHWVVAHQYRQRPNGELEVRFRDPWLKSNTSWLNFLAMAEDIADSGLAATQPNTQTVVVGAATAPRGRGRGRRSREREPERLEEREPRQLPDDIADRIARDLADREDFGQLTQDTRVEAVGVASLAPGRPPYYLVHYVRAQGSLRGRTMATVLVDGLSFVAKQLATPLDPLESLPSIPSPSTLSEGVAVVRDDAGTAGAVPSMASWLDPGRLSPTLAWGPGEASRSPFDPLYVLRPGADAGGPVYGRYDAETNRLAVVSDLTRRAVRG